MMSLRDGIPYDVASRRYSVAGQRQTLTDYAIFNQNNYGKYISIYNLVI